MAGWERRTRDALLVAMLPRPRPGLPALQELDLDGFWRRYAQSAPASLRLGLRVATWLLGLSPLLLMGRPRTFAGLTAEDRDTLLARASKTRLPLLPDLVLVLKVIACFAYFRDPGVQAEIRGEAP